VLLAANADGKEIGGRLARADRIGVLSDVVEVKEGGKGIHSIFGGPSPSRRRSPVTCR